MLMIILREQEATDGKEKPPCIISAGQRRGRLRRARPKSRRGRPSDPNADTLCLTPKASRGGPDRSYQRRYKPRICDTPSEGNNGALAALEVSSAVRFVCESDQWPLAAVAMPMTAAKAWSARRNLLRLHGSRDPDRHYRQPSSVPSPERMLPPRRKIARHKHIVNATTSRIFSHSMLAGTQ